MDPAKMAIKTMLPHREPFLYVDRIVSVAGHHLVAERFIRPDEDFFRGHYPGQPIMPGVLLCECVFQAGALLVSTLLSDEQKKQGLPVVTRIRDARFRRPVMPGDRLEISVDLTETLGGAYMLKGHIQRDGQKIMSVGFACTLVKISSSTP